MNNPANNPFNNILDWRGANSTRWSRYADHVLPLWVADMDFAIAEPITHVLQEHIAKYPLVYSTIDDHHNGVVAEYLRNSYGWEVEPDWITWIPGVVPGIYTCVNSMLGDRQSVIVPDPVYPPFFTAVQNATMVRAPLHTHNGAWCWPMPEATGQEGMLLMCHPHNPTGKVFTNEELQQVANYCCDHDLILCSDEIYADLILDDMPHQPIASLHSDIAQRSITLMSAGKTWNISGMGTAFAVIANRGLRQTFRTALTGLCPEPSILGVKATCAAFSQGQQWRQQLLDQLRRNRHKIDQTVQQLPGLEWIPNQATFLAWLRCQQPHATVAWQQLLDDGLALSAGSPFGDAEYVRLNYGCTDTHLETALEKMRRLFS